MGLVPRPLATFIRTSTDPIPAVQDQSFHGSRLLRAANHQMLPGSPSLINHGGPIPCRCSSKGPCGWLDTRGCRTDVSSISSPKPGARESTSTYRVPMQGVPPPRRRIRPTPVRSSERKRQRNSQRPPPQRKIHFSSVQGLSRLPKQTYRESYKRRDSRMTRRLRRLKRP
jgi:hypothetical protein